MNKVFYTLRKDGKYLMAVMDYDGMYYDFEKVNNNFPDLEASTYNLTWVKIQQSRVGGDIVAFRITEVDYSAE